jgi:short-subunit dehydrogenase
MQEVIPLMKKRGGGAIVNVSSGLALMNLANTAAYSSLKSALAHLSRIANEEHKKDGIVISVMYPFITDTDFEKNTIKEEYESEWQGGDGEIPQADPPEYIAEKIITGIVSGATEIYAHDWMVPGSRKKRD